MEVDPPPPPAAAAAPAAAAGASGDEAAAPPAAVPCRLCDRTRPASGRTDYLLKEACQEARQRIRAIVSAAEEDGINVLAHERAKDIKCLKDAIAHIGEGHIEKVFPQLFDEDGKYVFIDEPPNTTAALERMGVEDSRPDDDLINATAHHFAPVVLQAFDEILTHFKEVAGDADGSAANTKAALQAAASAKGQITKLTYPAYAHAFAPACRFGLESRALVAVFRKAFDLRIDDEGWAYFHCLHCHQDVDVLMGTPVQFQHALVTKFFLGHLRNGCSMCPPPIRDDENLEEWSSLHGSAKGLNLNNLSPTKNYARYVVYKAAKAGLIPTKLSDGTKVQYAGRDVASARFKLNVGGVGEKELEQKYGAFVEAGDKMMHGSLESMGHPDLIGLDLNDILGYNESLIVTGPAAQINMQQEVDNIRAFVHRLRTQEK